MKTDICTFMIISRRIIHRMRNVSGKSCRENQNTHFMFHNMFPKIVPFMRQCGKNIVEWDRPRMTIWRMRIACWYPKATDTHTHTHRGCGLLIAFPLQHSLNERASPMRYAYISCLVYFSWCQLWSPNVPSFPFFKYFFSSFVDT